MTKTQIVEVRVHQFPDMNIEIVRGGYSENYLGGSKKSHVYGFNMNRLRAIQHFQKSFGVFCGAILRFADRKEESHG